MPKSDTASIWRQAAVVVDARRASGLVALAAMLVYGFFAAAHWLVLDGQERLIMAGTAAASAVAAAIILVLVRAVGLRGEFVVNTVLAMVAINTLLHLWVSSDPRQTSNVVLVVVAMGFFMLRRSVAASSIALVVAAWVLLMPRDAGELLHYGFSMLSAVVLALLVSVMRRRLLFAATRAAHAWANTAEAKDAEANAAANPDAA